MSDEPTTPRTARSRLLRPVVMLGLSVLAGLAGWKLAASMDDTLPSTATATTGHELAYTQQSAQNKRDAFRELLTKPNDADPLRLNPVHEPLDAEPAGLEPFPGDHARHETRYRLAQGSVIDEVSFWRIAADPAAIYAHYRQAANHLGMIEIPRTDDENPNSSLLFSDPGEQQRVLTVRLAPLGDEQHLTLWLRRVDVLP